MKLPTCCHCEKELKYKDLLKLTFAFRQHLQCSNCHMKQYVTKTSRAKTSLLTFPFLFLFFFLQYLQIPFAVLFPSYIIAAIGVLFLMPFFYSFTNDEEPLW
ncbi:TIGR04104 family putative zinc finger protein [Bacillus alveayuensis]|uniref:TIGR04104 family putative zinc finger protein n=1 Tax=Aeribacillus alveayuensis TaxID=279215 RepID=UPI0005CD6A35|nr:TIGR04104 family putative zinc finger protein [Bacillus alveayuensis]